ncbi:MAG: DUF5522 domain-containing protein [Verrucomicrobiota bacterium]
MHAAACREGEAFYTDPELGLSVFTEVGLLERGKCCGSGCRHCPYFHENVPAEKRAAKIKQAAWLTKQVATDEPVDVLFWSGGKDSFLTLLELQSQGVEKVVLLTTFDVQQRFVAHQEIAIAQVVRQAEHLGLPLLGVPLHPGRDYNSTVEPALRKIPQIRRLVFGDLHLEHIRGWREEAFAAISLELGAPLDFPLWHADYDGLMERLEGSRVPCEVTAVTHRALGAVKVGDYFDRQLTDRLPEEVDQFGENGEFHTLAKVWEA